MSEPITTQQSPAPVPETPPARTFTQEEVDALIGKRLAKAMKGIPSDDELTAYRAWKAGRQTEAERQAGQAKELSDSKAALAAAQTELEDTKRALYVSSKGYTGDEAEFLAFKAGKMVNDKMSFEQAVDTLTADRKKTTFDWTAPVGGNQKGENSTNATMNALIRGKFQ